MTKRNIPYIHTLHLALTPRSREEPQFNVTKNKPNWNSHDIQNQKTH